MTAVVARASERKMSALERSLSEIARADARTWPDWLQKQRREALAWLGQHGLTKPRDDAWRNTPITALLDQCLTLASGAGTANTIATRSDWLAPAAGPVLWIVNGVAMTDAAPVPGVRWLPIRDAIRIEPKAREHLGALARVENGFVATNQAAFDDGWCLLVEPGYVVESPIEVRLVESAERNATLSLPRLLVVAGAASRLQLIERHFSSSGNLAVSASVVELVLESGAKLEHARLVDHGPNTWSVMTTAARLADDAEYRAWSATVRGRFVRNDHTVRISGQRATATLDGLYFARKNSIAAECVRVWHEQPASTTKECFRGVVEDLGRGVFDGIVYVGRNANGTDARQENRNLLLGPAAIANTKPHLEIDNDDVTCSHGATVGQLDEQQMFYLRARGIAEDEARAVLTWAFAEEIVQRCPNQALQEAAERLLEVGGTTDSKLRDEVAP